MSTITIKIYSMMMMHLTSPMILMYLVSLEQGVEDDNDDDDVGDDDDDEDADDDDVGDDDENDDDV